MLVPDFMHEFELGVWKSLFTHLIRLLWATTPNGSTVMEFNKQLALSILIDCKTILNMPVAKADTQGQITEADKSGRGERRDGASRAIRSDNEQGDRLDKEVRMLIQTQVPRLIYCREQ